MPALKRTRTTASERSGTHNDKKLQRARREIAAEAARIMATQGQHNYRIAKQKAVERLAAGTRYVMPSNVEVETALRAYQAFYGGEQHHRQVRRLRETAVRIMRSLEPYHPRLVGPVLEGTADRNTTLTLHVFNDPPEAVVMHLLDRGLVFRNEQRSIRWHNGSSRQVPLLVIEVEDTTVELTLFKHVDLRQAPPSPVDGRPQKRASVTEVERLLAAGTGAPA